MNSHDTDISAQASQLRPATGSTLSYQNSTRATSNFVPSPVVRDRLRSTPAQLQGTSRPHSIGELAGRVKRFLGEDSRPFNAWLRLAETARVNAKDFQEQGDFESAFVEFAKAASIVLEKIPEKRDYRVVFNQTQRHTLGLHGQKILDRLAELKIIIVQRYEQWQASHSSVQLKAQDSNSSSAGHWNYSGQPAISLPLPNGLLHPGFVPSFSSFSDRSPSHSMSQHQLSQGYLRLPSLGPRGSDHVASTLKPISFPRDCVNSFTSIASINTVMKRQTCGLLLGKDNGWRYIVTTLLIPKQHATSDTCQCAIDEEEIVMQFTEERCLITLGWIHTHTTESCFMSSVDLHTHSRFQRMLPESIVVVCAPNSTPSFGIFRLTDPAGLQTILQCAALAALHPHPDVPIYTDADKVHVHISDIPWEIVDLRKYTAPESTDGLIALLPRRRAVARPSEDTLGVVKGSLPQNIHFKAGHDEEGEEEVRVAHAARTAGGHDEPISQPETPKQRPAIMHPEKTPAQCHNASHKFTLPLANHSEDLALPSDASSSMQSEVAANPTSEIFEGFDTLHPLPESQVHNQQPEYLRILQDKFGTPRSDRGQGYSFRDDTNSVRDEEDGNYRKSFVDPENESCNDRSSVKTVTKGSLFTPSILSPARSQLSSIFD